MDTTSIKERLSQFLSEASYSGGEVVGEGLGKDAILTMVGRIIQQVLIFAAVIFIILLLYAGFIWMKAQGNEEEVKKAIGLFRTAILGMIILTFAAAITYTIIYYLTFASTTTS